MKKIILVSFLFSILSANSFAGENKSADAQAVDSACSQDSATAGCGSEKVGTGMLKCMHAYKKEHHEFKFSDGCKSAMKTIHQNKKSK